MLLPVENGSLFYETIGTGPPLMLMHGGLGLDHTVFRPWLDPLGERAKLIYFDFLANGRSEYTGDPEELTHDLWIETTDRLREHLGDERVVLFGHSYGGLLALEYALRHPQRVAALIVCNVTPVLDYPEQAMANAQRMSPDEGTLQAITEVMSGRATSDAALAEVLGRTNPAYFHRWDPAVGEALFDDVEFRAVAYNRSVFDCLPTFDIREELGSIDVPTLVISGADDWIMPPELGGERIATGLPDAEHVILDESGHWPFVEENARFLDIVERWLARRDLLRERADG